ncbi:MAG TPA: hypothetical protein VFZ40_11445 [Pyrinomonadaceae bacterium]
MDRALESAAAVSHVIAMSRWGDTVLAETSVERDDDLKTAIYKVTSR